VPLYVYGLVGAAMVVAAVLTVVAGRRDRARSGDSDSDALGFIGGVFNAMFIVVLAFYTVITWTDADAAGQGEATEASDLIEIYWQSTAVAEPERGHVRALIREYTEEVVEREWPALGRGESDPKAEDLLVTLRAELIGLPATTDEAAAAREQTLQSIRSVADARRDLIAQGEGGGDLLALLLIGTVLGAVIMIGFPLLIGFSAGFRHITSIVLLAALLGFAVYFAIELDQPFGGLIKVEPDSLRAALAEYQNIP
jgi:Protein of unknown function (DUF4239)